MVCRIYCIKEIHPLKGKMHYNLFNHFNRTKIEHDESLEESCESEHIDLIWLI